MTNDLDEDKILYHLHDWNMGLHEHIQVWPVWIFILF